MKSCFATSKISIKEIAIYIFQKYALEDMGTHQLAMDLTEGGMLPRKGISWHPSTLLHLLKNIQYKAFCVVVIASRKYNVPIELDRNFKNEETQLQPRIQSQNRTRNIA